MTLQLVTKSSESRLIQMTGDIRDQPVGWQGVHFRLSELLEEYKSEYQIKIAINLIHDLLKTYEGAIFVMADSSIIVLCFNLEAPVLEKLIFQLRYLYMDDPLCYTENGEENPEFSHVYDLRRSGQGFYELALRYMAHVARNKTGGMQQLPAMETAPTPVADAFSLTGPVLESSTRPVASVPRLPKSGFEQAEPPDVPDHEMSASKLVAIERNLRVVNLQSVVRRQSVCAVLADMKVRRVFDELYIHIAQLRSLMRSDVDFFSNRWLFRYLTQILDVRMIELIRSRQSTYLASPISLNLNIETLLSSVFTEFDATLKPAAKVSIVIEVPVVDMFADMVGFKAAVAEVQALGYRVCLDGLSSESITYIDRQRLGLDLVKVQWNADTQADIKGPDSAVANSIQAIGHNRIILCRCDNRRALEYGMALGISLFQGRYLDGLLNPTAKVEN